MNALSGSLSRPLASRQLSRKAGSVAVEFAFVLPLLLGLVYSVIVYSMIYVFQQAINFAAQQGAEAAVAVIPGADSRQAAERAAGAAVNSSLSWMSALPGGIPQPTFSGCGATNGAFVVRIPMTPTQLSSIFPPIVNLPLLGTFPPLPANGLSACAVVVS